MQKYFYSIAMIFMFIGCSGGENGTEVVINQPSEQTTANETTDVTESDTATEPLKPGETSTDEKTVTSEENKEEPQTTEENNNSEITSEKFKKYCKDFQNRIQYEPLDITSLENDLIVEKDGIKFTSRREKFNEYGVKIDSSLTLFYPQTTISKNNFNQIIYLKTDKELLAEEDKEKDINFEIRYGDEYLEKKFYVSYKIIGEFTNTFKCEEWSFTTTNVQEQEYSNYNENVDDGIEPPKPQE